MNRIAPVLATLISLACSGEATPPAAASGAEAAHSAAGPDRIAVAMSGAPAALASGATIGEFDASGNLVLLRAGTNGWTCIADDSPAAPGDSPNCLDARWQDWFDAYAAGKAPSLSGLGVAYMLQGSLSPSNTDPFAQTPPAGQAWMEDGPHVMVIVPDPAQLEGFPTEHGTGGPYVMFAGTPYAHLMVPTGGGPAGVAP